MTPSGRETDVAIIGGGIAGLVLALSLKEIGVDCRVYEAVPELKPLGVGINLLPHAVKEMDQLGLIDMLDRVGIRAQDASYFNRFGQHIYTEPVGESAGYPWPQFSLHRGELQMALAAEVRERIGPDALVTGHRCTGVTLEDDAVSVHFVGPQGEELPPVRATVAVGCDGIKSSVRRQFYPGEGDPVYSGLTVWRAATPYHPILSGANVTRIGWMPVGKLIVYPIIDSVDGEGRQLMNFVATLERPKPDAYDWNRPAQLEDFFEPFADWTFDWLDVPDLLRSAERYMEFPMVDRDPVPTWTYGRVTLMGDAAHPMYQRGSNGAGQAIIDARTLTGCFKRMGVTPEALREYDGIRVPPTSRIVLMNRTNPPDAILREVYERSGDRPFRHINDVIGQSELDEIITTYKSVAGYDIEQLRRGPSLV